MRDHPLPRALVRAIDQAIDYAGLFPPAALPLEGAVANYARYRISGDRWALGRLVLPAARLKDVPAVVPALPPGTDLADWRVSATMGSDWIQDLGAIASFNARELGRVDAIEAKVADTDAVTRLARAADGSLRAYGEVTPGPGVDDRLRELAREGLAAKLRMGGTVPDLFPDSEAVVDFLEAVTGLGLCWKATAGLHHPLRGTYPLTYDAGSACAPMYGYLNLVLAGLLAQEGDSRDRLREVLLEAEAGAISADDEGLEWRGRRFGLTAIDRLRATFHGFGSCSFREPLDELLGAIRA